MKNIPISKAIRMGTLFVNVPVFILLISGTAIESAFEKMHIFPEEFGWLSYSGYVLSFLFAWLWWSFTIPWWRYWAYQRVDSISQLKTQAIKAGLIWPNGSFFERTEIKPKKLNLLEQQLGDKLNT
jgi:hypothetical protein